MGDTIGVDNTAIRHEEEQSLQELSGKVAVVTGAGSGIGRALVEAFASEGMRLVVADIDPDRLEQTADELRRGDVEVVVRVTDVAEGAEIEALAETALDAFGAVHVVCNNAGIGGGGMVSDFDVEQWQRVIDVDLWSVLHGMRVFLPILIEQGEGHVVNTASVAGLFAPPFMGPYDVSKAGVVAISEAAFNELAVLAPGVGISVVCPGWVRTNIGEDQLARAQPATEEEAALAAAFADMIRGFIDSGMEPADVARQVVDAIKVRRFYVLTHPTSADMVRRRMEAIVEGHDPPPIGPDQF
jgi:NAD(P)-dependent dehydrogenase (short-subunit alcohol dehydrogenase family)